MTDPTISPSSAEDEISLKDLLLKIKEWFVYLLSKWMVIVAAGIIGSGIGLSKVIDKKPIYTATLTTGSGTATLNTSTGRYTLSAADSRFSVVAKYGAGAPESDADFMERKAPIPYTYRVATGPYACHGCSAPLGHAAPCCAGGGCGCGTFHTAGAFAYTGFWACCAPGYDETGYYSFTSTGYTWSGADYTNGSGEWYKIT